MNRLKAQQLLKTALANPEADFRAGQWEAIDALVNHRQKLLVVQRTGWGKSAVYFISARIFRDRGLGLTIIISPLLALMRNQIVAARRLGINAVTMNSTNTDDWLALTQQILANEIDCLLISPERLANDKFVETVLQPIADRIAFELITGNPILASHRLLLHAFQIEVTKVLQAQTTRFILRLCQGITIIRRFSLQQSAPSLASGEGILAK